MIFLSHNKADKDVVEPIANVLVDKFGKENVFYDSWSICPGDSIIGKMDEGLEKCRFFFLFMSPQSLTSNFVKLEWRTALIRSLNADVKFIPIKLTDCKIPTILIDTVYINMYEEGFDRGVENIIGIIEGKNDIPKQEQVFSNLSGKVYQENGEDIVEITALKFVEHNPMVLIATKDDILHTQPSNYNYMQAITGKKTIQTKIIKTGMPDEFNALSYELQGVLSPDKPLKIRIHGNRINVEFLVQSKNGQLIFIPKVN